MDSYQITHPHEHTGGTRKRHTWTWRIYADGTWKSHTPPHTDHYILTGNTHTRGESLVLMATDGD